MKKRRIWAGLSTAVLVAAPVASQAAGVTASSLAAIEAKAHQHLLHLAKPIRVTPHRRPPAARARVVKAEAPRSSLPLSIFIVASR